MRPTFVLGLARVFTIHMCGVKKNAPAVQNSDVFFSLQESNVVLNVMRLPVVWKQQV